MKYFLFSLLLSLFSCAMPAQSTSKITVGAERFDEYLNQIKGVKIGMVVNHTSLVNTGRETEHLVDFLLAQNVNITTIFAPEHGFRGKADAGEMVDSGKDKKTGLPIISLYGSHKKPTAEDLADVDILIFDIQDVGARFYTYISTMHYIMEAAAENQKKVFVMDRPNPNGFYVDGPVLDPEFRSFVGMHPIPVVHGLTVGELAQMINGEKWLKNGVKCGLRVIPCKGYDHNTLYELPVKPSPNLPNNTSIYLYPSLCFLEPTPLSIGRGTAFPFQVIGHPKYKGEFTFTPKPTEGAKNPKLNGENCIGLDLRNTTSDYFVNRRSMDLSWLLDSYMTFKDDPKFFTPFFDKLAGTDLLRKLMQKGANEDEIRASWQKDLTEYKKLRKKYLLYPDFE